VGLLKEKGFITTIIKTFEEIEKEHKTTKNIKFNFLSKLFSYYGKIKSKVNKELRKNNWNYRKKIKKLSTEKKYMNGYLIKSVAIK
jgi:hypothetical protein